MKHLSFFLVLVLAGCGKELDKTQPASSKSCDVIAVEEQCLVTIEKTTCGPKFHTTAYDPELCAWIP